MLGFATASRPLVSNFQQHNILGHAHRVGAQHCYKRSMNCHTLAYNHFLKIHASALPSIQNRYKTTIQKQHCSQRWLAKRSHEQHRSWEKPRGAENAYASSPSDESPVWNQTRGGVNPFFNVLFVLHMITKSHTNRQSIENTRQEVGGENTHT